MSHEPLIAVDPGGRPIIAGTHVAVADILKALAASEAVDVVLATHPELSRDAVQAALAYAADTMQGREPPPSPALVQALGAFEPTTPLAKQLWARRKAVVAAALARGEPLLQTWDDVAQEVRERRGERECEDAQ